MADPSATPHVAELRRSLEDLIAESQALRSDMKTGEQARKRENHINMALLGLLALFVFMVLVIAWQNNSIASDTRNTNARMADCTTPGGRCYEQGTKRTSGAIQTILHTQIAALQCARQYPGVSGPEYDRLLERCVIERVSKLSDSDSTATPTPVPVPTASPTK